MSLSFKNMFRVFALLLSLAVVQSCSDDPTPPKVEPDANGYFIVNEGAFQKSDASISFYNSDTDEMINNVFAAVNSRPLGDQAQSMTVIEDRGYIIVQNSGKIEVIKANDFTSVTTIDDQIESPRYMIQVNTNKAYVSDWGADGVTGTIKVVELSSNKVVKTIPTGQGANKMVKVGDVVYVTNAGGWGIDNTITTINSKTDVVAGTITVGDNPNSIQVDAAGNIWVTSSGNTVYNEDWSVDEENSTKGAISKITDGEEAMRLTAEDLGSISNLNISPDGTKLYYTYGGALYVITSSSEELPETPLKEKSYYGVSVDPSTGNIIGCVAPNFSSAGSIEVLKPSGELIKSYTVGIGPNGCAFK